MKKNTMELWHGTLVMPYNLTLEPKSFCLGNAAESPANVTYFWRSWEEAAKWSVYVLISYFKEFLINPGANPVLFDHIGFRPIPDFLFPDDFILDGFAWDPLKKSIIIVDDEENRIAYNNIQKYLDIWQPLTLQFKVIVDKKKVGIGHTATIDEYTVNEPVTIVEGNKQTVNSGTLDVCVEWVPEEYYEMHTERKYASLFNRGLKSFLYSSELEYNVLENGDNYFKTRNECQNRDKSFVKKYLRDNSGCIAHLYPIKRIKLYMEAKRKLKAVQ